MRSHGEADGARGVGALAGHTKDKTPARVFEAPFEHDRQGNADEEHRADFKGRADRRIVAPVAERKSRQHRRTRLDEWLAEKERQADAENEQRDADGDVVDARQIADSGVQQPERGCPQRRQPACRARVSR